MKINKIDRFISIVSFIITTLATIGVFMNNTFDFFTGIFIFILFYNSIRLFQRSK